LIVGSYSIMFKFGNIDTIRFVIQIDNHVLYEYEMGSNYNTSPYDPSIDPIYEELYRNLKNSMLLKERSRIMKNFSCFEESILKENYELTKELELLKQNTGQYLQATRFLNEKLLENIRIVEEERENFKHQLSYDEIINSEFRLVNTDWNGGEGRLDNDPNPNVEMEINDN